MHHTLPSRLVSRPLCVGDASRTCDRFSAIMMNQPANPRRPCKQLGRYIASEQAAGPDHQNDLIPILMTYLSAVNQR
jgi:hypothetical protein